MANAAECKLEEDNLKSVVVAFFVSKTGNCANRFCNTGCGKNQLISQCQCLSDQCLLLVYFICLAISLPLVTVKLSWRVYWLSYSLLYASVFYHAS